MSGFQSSLCLFLVCCIFSSYSLANGGAVSPPVVYTIAGSDSGGGAGIQADLHAIHAMKCHGCSAITCLTAQNSVGVSGVHAPPATFLQQQLNTLLADMPPLAIKIGMLGTQELALAVGDFLKQLCNRKQKVWVVLDPVMITTSGHKLIDEDAKQAMIQHVFPHADILTPNKFEAEDLVGRKFYSNADVEQGAQDLLKMGMAAVLIKGGHTLKDVKYAQDYFLSSSPPKTPGEERLFEQGQGIWLRSSRYDTDNTHGTGCTLSSAIASALAFGEQGRNSQHGDGVTTAVDLIDASCLAKAYVTAGIFHGVQYGKGPGPVAQTEFPSSFQHFPSLVNNPSEHDDDPAFCPMKSFSTDDDNRPMLGRILPVVDTVEWVERLAQTPGVTDIQLRIKDESDPKKILQKSCQCQELCQAAGIRLWINDHWEAAVEVGCFGVHVGQEDLVKCIQTGGVEAMRKRGMALGISTHSYAELSAALGMKPSYVSMGPVFATMSKSVKFKPQGLPIVSKWRQLIPPDIPFVAIGGINDAGLAKQVRDAGADCVAVIGAVTSAKHVDSAVAGLNDAMV